MISNLASVHSALRDWIRSRRAGNRITPVLRPIPLWGWVLLASVLWRADVLAQPRLLDLHGYPRPARDNGWGIHWAPALLTQPPAIVERYLGEVDALNLRWLKLMQPDQASLEHRYLLAQLAARGIEPVLQVHKIYNDPYQHLETLVQEGVAAGVHYYELYTNPNVAGLDGGWRSGETIDPARLARNWIDAARTVRAAGGYPGLPSLSPGGAIADTDFLRRFLAELQTLNALDTLDGAWLPVQNYMGNLPLEDTNGFRKFEAYHQIVQETTGRTLPIISTEGGAIAGAGGDPRYPLMTSALVAERTVAAFQYMQNAAPDYYFAFMPWLLVNAAAGGVDNEWEAHAWFPATGDPRPVVEAVKALVQGDPLPAQPSVPPADLQYAQQTPAQPLGAGEPETREAGEPATTHQPPPTNHQPPTEQPFSPGRVALGEGTVVLPTYDYERAFVQATRDDPIWPAPRLDHDQVGPPTPRAYRSLVLENDFLRLTILPELGGRIYRWEDKRSGRDILYHNPVVKPTHWGVRGWWLATGGMEWSFPLPDHGLYEYRPWRAETVADARSAAVYLYHDGPDGLAVRVSVGLNADTRFFAVTVELRNTGTQQISTHFWHNALLAPSAGNSVDPQSRLIWPADQFTVHGSAGTRSLPMGATLDWPAGSGQDVGLLANWPQHLSFFATPAPRWGAVGLVDPDGDLAVIRSFPAQMVPGLKTFYGAGLDPALWTDGGSGRYFELWGGPGRDFNTPVRLAPQQSLRWTEQWYTVPGLGEFVAANAHAALALHPNGNQTELRLATTGSMAMRSMVTKLVVRVDGAVVFDQAVTLSADELYRQTFSRRFDGHHWLVQLIDEQNRVLFAYDNQAEPPVDGAAPADPIEWDERLDELNVEVLPADVRAGQTYWKVIKAEFQTPEEGGGRHHIFVEVVDEAGERMVGEAVEVHWQDGSATIVTEDKPAPEYAANFPMYNTLGGYRLKMPGPSDTVVGMGLPWGRLHVVYNVVFQRTVKK